MRNLTTILVVALVAVAMSYDTSAEQETKQAMKLGNFSISLAVKDINKSKAFYEKLGFKEVGGKIEQNWIILQNERCTIGLFQGMFPNNIMTFNPGWNHKKETLKDFMDVRKIQEQLEKSGIKLTTKADPATTGPASLVIADPDGNTILIDQHVPAPRKSK